jgi:hypothetical protein
MARSKKRSVRVKTTRSEKRVTKSSGPVLRRKVPKGVGTARERVSNLSRVADTGERGTTGPAAM